MNMVGKTIKGLVTSFTFTDRKHPLIAGKSLNQTPSKVTSSVSKIAFLGILGLALIYLSRPLLFKAYAAIPKFSFPNDMFNRFFSAKPKDKPKKEEIVVDKERIEREKKITQIEQKFQVTLNQIATDLQRDLFPDETTVTEKYKILSTFFTELPKPLSEQKKLELRTLINRTLIEKELRNKGKLLGKQETEIEILKNLGINVEGVPEYFDKECLYKVITTFIMKELNSHLNENIKLSSGEIRKKMSDYALKAKLATLGIKEEEKITKFQHLLDFDAHFKNLQIPQDAFLTTLATHSTDVNLQPKTKNLINNYYVAQVSYFLSKTTDACIRSGKDKFNLIGNLEDFTKVLQNKKNEIELDFNQKLLIDANSILKFPEVQFLLKWSKNLKKECYQGQSDTQEVLGYGVCWAVNQRVERRSKAYPNQEPEEVFSGEILSIDRANQALYITTGLTKSKCQFGESNLFNISVTNNPLNLEPVKQNIRDQIKNIQANHGWMMLGLGSQDGGHAISLRLDKNHKKFWLVDANFGLFEFKNDNQHSENNIEECLECFSAIITTFYPTTNSIWGIQRN